MSKGYTTKTKVENYILNDIDASFDAQIDDWIESAEGYIDRYTGRNFIADTEATARLFDGDGEQGLLIDEVVEITLVESGNDSYGSSFSEVPDSGADRYFEFPANHAVKNLAINKLVLNARAWPSGMQNNRVTGKWGFSATVPEDIAFVATILVAGIVNQQRGGGDQIKQERIGNYSVSYSQDDGDSLADYKRAMQILDQYKLLVI